MKLTAPWTKLRCFAPPTAGNKGPQCSHMCELRKRCWRKCGDDITISCAFGLIHAPSQMYHFHPFNLPIPPIVIWQFCHVCLRLGHRTFYVSRNHLSNEFTPLPAVFASVLHPMSLESAPKSVNSSLFNLMFLPPWWNTLSPMCILPATGSTF